MFTNTILPQTPGADSFRRLLGRCATVSNEELLTPVQVSAQGDNLRLNCCCKLASRARGTSRRSCLARPTEHGLVSRQNSFEKGMQLACGRHLTRRRGISQFLQTLLKNLECAARQLATSLFFVVGQSAGVWRPDGLERVRK